MVFENQLFEKMSEKSIQKMMENQWKNHPKIEDKSM